MGIAHDFYWFSKTSKFDVINILFKPLQLNSCRKDRQGRFQRTSVLGRKDWAIVLSVLLRSLQTSRVTRSGKPRVTKMVKWWR